MHESDPKEAKEGAIFDALHAAARDVQSHADSNVDYYPALQRFLALVAILGAAGVSIPTMISMLQAP